MLILGILAAVFYVFLKIASAREPVEVNVVRSGVDDLSVFLDKLANCESQNRPWIKTLDSNNRFSYGLLQFQSETWIAYATAYKLFPNAEKKELMNFIYDGEAQKSLARKILEEDPKNARNWTVCSKRINQPPYMP